MSALLAPASELRKSYAEHSSTSKVPKQGAQIWVGRSPALQSDGPLSEEKAIQKSLAALDILTSVADCRSTNVTMSTKSLELPIQNYVLG